METPEWRGAGRAMINIESLELVVASQFWCMPVQ